MKKIPFIDLINEFNSVIEEANHRLEGSSLHLTKVSFRFSARPVIKKIQLRVDGKKVPILHLAFGRSLKSQQFALEMDYKPSEDEDI